MCMGGNWLGFISGIDPLYSFSGLIVGFLVGMTGVGGGSLMTPILVILFGVHPVTAVGTDLLFATVTKTVGTTVHGFNNTINWKIVRSLAAGSIPAALITLWLVAGERSENDAGSLTAVIGAMLVIVAFMLIFRPLLVNIIKRFQSRHLEMSDKRAAAATTVLGLVLGTLVTMSSVGAGAMGVTVLLILFPTMKVRDIIGSDIVHAVPLTLIAGAGYWFLGEVDNAMLLSLVVGSVPGVVIGSMIAPKMPDRILRPVLAAVLAAAGGKMLLS